MNFYKQALSFSFLLLCLVGFAQNKPAKIMESFEEGIPNGMRANGGELSIDSDRMKHGEKGLKWNWSGNSQLIFDSPVGYHKQQILAGENLDLNNGHGGSETNPVLEPPRGFMLWVYNDTPTKQRLRIQFGRDEEVDCEFDFNLNFKGWRNMVIAYDRGDMRGVPREDMTRLTINAPASGSGTFYFDMLGMSVTMNPRTVNPNPQLPEIDQHPRLVAQYPHLLMEYSQYKPTFQLDELNAQTVSDFRKIEKQITDIYWPEYKKDDFTNDKFAKVKAKYDAFEIRRDGDKIYGRPLLNSNVINDHFGELNLPKDERFKGIMRWRHDFNYAMRDVSNLYYYSDSPEIKEQLAEMFINLFDYGLDQGFDAGAGLGWIHHYSYVIREYGPAVYVMRDVLKEHKRLEKAEEVCRWFYAFNQVYNEEKVYNVEGRVAGNADEIQGLLMPKLMTALLQDDSPEKARDLKHFSSYLSNVFTGYAQALDETFKPDGTIFHHAGHSFGYGGRAINGAVSTMYMLSGTEFATSLEAYFRMSKVLETYLYQMFTNKVMAPKAFANIRFSNYDLPKQFYNMPALLALTSEEFDEEMAALFDDLLAVNDKADEMLDFWKKKVDSKRKTTLGYNYTRCEIFPYTNVGINRKANDYMITVRAHSKYVYPFESWGKSFFAFPLFIANGYLDVSYPESLDALTPAKGTWHSGYNWHRWPGTTSVNLPYDKMLTDPGQVRDEGGEYLFSDQAFSGGVSSSYGCGVYAFQFKGHDKFNLEGFTGKKTYFFVDDMVVCLGSDIQSDLEYQVETTLFQTFLKNESDPTVLNTRGVVDNFDYEYKHDVEEPMWMIDNRNTGFFVISTGKESELILERKRQQNPDSKDQNMVSGNFATAVINHGIAPKEASYQYILVADANTEKMEALATEMTNKMKPIEILKQDNEAHVVALNNKKTMAYAVYAENGLSLNNGLVAKVNKQATFMIKEDGDNIILSVADPDLNIYDGQDDLLPNGSRCELSIYEREWFYWPSRSTKVQITLKGKWNIKKQIQKMETAHIKDAQIISSNKKETIIEMECRDGLSAEVLLTK